MTKIKKSMKAIFTATRKKHILAGICGALSVTIMITVISLGVSGNTTEDEISKTNIIEEETELTLAVTEKDTEAATEETTEETTEEITEEKVLSSIEAAETNTVTSVQNNSYTISESDYDSLLKIVQAEAGGEDETGKILVANVIFNRVNSSRFPNTVGDVIYAKGQFSPVAYSSFSNTKVSESTKIAVDKALSGIDYSQGALFFCANSSSGLFGGYTYIMTHGGHTFFK